MITIEMLDAEIVRLTEDLNATPDASEAYTARSLLKSRIRALKDASIAATAERHHLGVEPVQRHHYFVISFMRDGLMKQSDWRHTSRNLRRSDLAQAALSVGTTLDDAVISTLHYLGYMTAEEYNS